MLEGLEQALEHGCEGLCVSRSFGIMHERAAQCLRVCTVDGQACGMAIAA